MPWYSQWPEGIKKRACRYLLQRYLGQYLKEKLTLDQLSVDLYNGTGTINELNLDVEALNEMCQTFNLPIEFVDGYVDRISVSIPWSSLLSESCFVEVQRLMMTLRPKQRSDQAASMFSSMWGSMTTSMQLAQECLRESDKDVEAAGAMEGLELFAQTIESVLCRIKVRFVDTTLRLENIPRGSKTGMALEIRIKKMDYFDEAGGEDLDKRDVNQPAAFTCKKFLWEGVNLYTDEFLCDNRRGGRYPSVGSSPESKMCESAFMTAPVTPEIVIDPVEFDGNGNTQEPVFFARLSGRQEIRLKVKQRENLEGVKVAADFILGSVIAFASPRQVHLLIELCNGLMTPGSCSQMHRCALVTNKQMQASDFEKVERELQRQLASAVPQVGHGLLQHQGWSSQTLDDSDDEFLPMGINRTMASSISSDIGSQRSFSAGSSVASSFQPSFPVGRPRLKTKSDSSAAEESATFKLQLSALAVVVLHEEVLTVGADDNGVLTQASLHQMRSMAESFFTKVGDFSPSGYGAKELFTASERLTAACRQSHLRLVAAPVTMDGNEKTLSGQRTLTACVTFGIAELVECLVEKEHIIHSKILYFPEDGSASASGNFYVPQPCLRLKVSHSLGSSCTQGRRLRHVTRPKTEIVANLALFAAEVDISIVDRVQSLLQPQLATKRDSGRCGQNDAYFLLNQRLMDNNSKLLADTLDNEDDMPDDVRTFAASSNARIDVSVTSPNATVSVRFPVPDLRPACTLDRLPWWRRSVRDDVLTLRLTEVALRISGDGPEVLDLRCRQFTGSLRESEKSEDVTFLWADSDSASKDEFNWPRLTLQIYPLQPTFIIEDPVNNMSDSFNGNSIDTVLLHNMHTARNAEPSPFSSRKVVYGNDAEAEQMIVPCDGAEMKEFMDRVLQNCRCILKLVVPALRIVLPNKHFYEVLYNRINTDLLLWEPSAPKPPCTVVGSDVQWRETFSICKSALQYDSGSDSEEGALSDGDCSTLGPTSAAKSRGQSKLCLELNVNRGSLSCRYPDVTTLQGYGELWVQVEDATLFVVNSFLGRATEDVVCFQANRASLHYSGLGCGGELLATLYQSEPGTVTRMSGLVGTGADSLNMLSVAVRMTLDPVVHRKTIRVAFGLRGTTLRHRVCSSGESWYSQLLAFFDVLDYPVSGYHPPAIVTELHLHTWGCAVDYRPLFIPLRSMVTLETLSVCSNLTAQTPTTVLRFIAEDAYLFVSDKLKASSVDLKNDYVCVVDFGFFELSLRMTESKDIPRFELSASNNVIHIRTCADSCRALQELLTYFANDGDLKVDRTEDDDSIGSHGTTDNLPSLQEMEQVHDLMEEAMQESSTCSEPHDTTARVPLDGSGFVSQEPAQVFLFPDEEGGRRSEELTVLADDEFCILENDLGVGIVPRTGEPQVRLLDPGNSIKMVENYFAPPLGRTDQLKAPKNFPMPVARYTLQDMSLVWHMYGGSDFSPLIAGAQKRTWNAQNKKCAGSPEMDIGFRAGTEEVQWPSSSSMTPPSTSFLSWQSRGGPGRQHHVLMELQMNKVRFRHELYPEGLEHASWQVLLVHEVEVRDRLADSQINKFLYQYSSEAMPRPSCANMLVIKATHVRPDPSLAAQECSLKVSMLPLRLNIDQDALFFLCTFFGQLSPSKSEGSSASDNKSQQVSSHQAPVMCVNSGPCSTLLLEDDDSESDDGSALCERSSSDAGVDCQASPVFFRSFVFSPDVPIRLDYHGKRVDMEQGALAGLIIGLGQLNCSELRLKRLRYRQGLLGFDRLLAYAIGEWLRDVRKYQLPSLLGGVGPMYSLVQLVQGIRDLFWLPIEQYRKDGRIVRGLQRGANAFTTSTAMAALELTTRLVHAIQSTAETAYDMVSPGPSVRQQRVAGARQMRKCHSQPADIREGVANAYQVVREGLGDTARNLVQVASEEHEHKGFSGAVGGVLRQIPSTVVKPIIVATEATSNVLGGVRHQLAPDTRREAAEKWRTEN